MYTLFQNKYGNLSKCTVDAIERMEKVGQQHQEDSEQVSEQIASDFATWLRGLPKGETEDINNTSADYIMQLFAERVNDNLQHYSKMMIIKMVILVQGNNFVNFFNQEDEGMQRKTSIMQGVGSWIGFAKKSFRYR